MGFKNEPRSSYLTTCPNCSYFTIHDPHVLYVAFPMGIDTIDIDMRKYDFMSAWNPCESLDQEDFLHQ